MAYRSKPKHQRSNMVPNRLLRLARVVNEFAEIIEPQLRPDGYVALRAKSGDTEELQRYLRELCN